MQLDQTRHETLFPFYTARLFAQGTIFIALALQYISCNHIASPMVYISTTNKKIRQ